jgi:chromosome segregation ATPase
VGIIGQELQKLYPELVKENAKGELSVNYSGLIPLVITAMKEQQNEIGDLKNKIAQLSTDNEEWKKVKNEIAELKKMMEKISGK